MYTYQMKLKTIKDLEMLYQALKWNKVGLSLGELEKMIEGSWYSLYVYHENKLIGTGRIISDGIITGVICGVGVLPSFQGQGIGKEIVIRLVNQCEKNKIFPQLLCDKSLVSFYESIGFEEFTVGMNYPIKR